MAQLRIHLVWRDVADTMSCWMDAGKACDASKMHLLFQALCLTIYSEILPYLNKTADSDAVFRKVSLLVIFAGNKIGEKYHVNIYGKEARGTKDGHEGCRRAKWGGPTRPGTVAVWAPQMGLVYTFWPSATPSCPSFVQLGSFP